MKKFLFATASLCAIALTSCQDNEIFDKPTTLTGDAKIKFAAIQNLGTKAASGNPFNNTDDLRKYGSFTVVGYGTQTPINGDEYVNAKPIYNGSTWEYKDEPYWPNQPLNFVAYAPNGYNGTDYIVGDDINPTLSNTGIVKTGFAVGVNNTQVDFVVAIEPGKTKESRTMLRFKHTLTQVLFKAIKVEGSNLDVEIDDVEICNIKNSGDFNAPMISAALKQNLWTPGANFSNYSAKPSAAVLIDVEDAVGNYNNAKLIRAADADNTALLMIPQNFKAWDSKIPIGTNDGNGGAKGAYVKINALITTTINSKTVLLWGTDLSTSKPLYIPVQSLGLNGDLSNDPNDKNTSSHYGQWVPGRRVNYIITFGDKGSGSSGGGFDENGDPVLLPIRFTAMVEDWVDVDVPLLSATVEGTSNDTLSSKMIAGYTNQVIMDIASTQYPKNFAAKVNIESKSTNTFTDFTLDVSMFKPVVSKLFRPGSTFTWNIKAVGSTWNAELTVPEAPEGWTWAGVNGGDKISTNKEIVLKKIAQPKLSWTSHLAYIDDHTLAIQKNIGGLPAPEQVTYTVTCSDIGFDNKKAYYFETGYLNKAVNAGYLSKSAIANVSTVTYDFNALDFTDGTGSITMYIPVGWTGSGGELSSDGSYIIIDKNTGVDDKFIEFTMLVTAAPN